MSQGNSMVVSECFKGVSRVFQGHFKGLSRVFQGYFKCDSRLFPGCFKAVSLVFQGYFKGVSGCFRVISSVCPWCQWVFQFEVEIWHSKIKKKVKIWKWNLILKYIICIDWWEGKISQSYKPYILFLFKFKYFLQSKLKIDIYLSIFQFHERPYNDLLTWTQLNTIL